MSSLPQEPYDRLSAILARLLGEASLRAVLLVDKNGTYVASHGDPAAMERVAETHFENGLDYACLSRDADGSTVLSPSSGEAVRFEAVAGGRCILTLVAADPLTPERMRPRIDEAKRALDKLFAEILI